MVCWPNSISISVLKWSKKHAWVLVTRLYSVVRWPLQARGCDVIWSRCLISSQTPPAKVAWDPAVHGEKLICFAADNVNWEIDRHSVQNCQMARTFCCWSLKTILKTILTTSFLMGKNDEKAQISVISTSFSHPNSEARTSATAGARPSASGATCRRAPRQPCGACWRRRSMRRRRTTWRGRRRPGRILMDLLRIQTIGCGENDGTQLRLSYRKKLSCSKKNWDL